MFTHVILQNTSGTGWQSRIQYTSGGSKSIPQVISFPLGSERQTGPAGADPASAEQPVIERRPTG